MSDSDYGVDLGGGWTVSVAFAHMGFWDRRQAELLRNWEIDDPIPESQTDDQLNLVLERYWQQITPNVSGHMAVDVAEEVDGIIASLPDEKINAFLDLGTRFMLARGDHREEHIDQIMREL
ncbi:MAG: hypothetical protein HQ478_04350 [Chloroflexi bacterium]|nr:hypothetical protein [Chloroflexota bacterium]